MALFKLMKPGEDLAKGELIEASHTSLELEQHLECWLERSPSAIAGEPLLVIGRQTSAAVESTTIFPDLLALDADGNVVIVELKRGKAPREVVAQLLEYAAWVSELSPQRIEEIATAYLAKSNELESTANPLAEAYKDAFELDEVPPLNQSQRLFIAAEEIPTSVARTCRFLRTSHGMDVNCVAFSVFQTEAGEILVNSEWIVGHEDVSSSEVSSSERWDGPPVKEVVWRAVQHLTNGDKTKVFAPKDVRDVILKRHPTFKKNTVGCQIIAGCVNHNSRKHYTETEDRYWWLGSGKYRLYDPQHDSKESE